MLVFKSSNMKKNMGFVDRAIRAVIAVIIGVLFFTNVITGGLGIVLLVLAFIMLFTSLVAYCPLYLPFGLNTLRRKIVTRNNSNK